MSTVLDLTSAWLLTYLIHSTLFVSSVWLVARYCRHLDPRLEETMWRVALFAPLVSAGLRSSSLGVIPSLFVTDGPSSPALELSSQVPPALQAPGASPLQEMLVVSPLSTPWMAALLSLWCTGVLLGLIRILIAGRRLRRLTSGGIPVEDRGLLGLLSRFRRLLGIAAPVEATVHPEITMPFAAGLLRPRVHLPQRVHELQWLHQESLMAHEMAHIARRDPAWTLAYRLVEVILFIQPLNRLARTRLHEVGELACDDLAVSCTGRRLDLAHCLLKVARWAGRPSPLPLTAAVPSPAQVGTRVRRLIATSQPGGRGAAWIPSLLLAALIVATFLLPGVTPATADEPPRAPTPPVQSVPEIEAPAPPSVANGAVPGPPAPAAPPAPRGLASAPAPAAEPNTPAPPRAPAPAAPPKPSETSAEPAPRSKAVTDSTPQDAPKPTPAAPRAAAPATSTTPTEPLPPRSVTDEPAPVRRRADAEREIARSRARAERERQRATQTEERRLATKRRVAEREEMRARARALRESCRAQSRITREEAAARRAELRTKHEVARQEARQKARLVAQEHRLREREAREIARERARIEAERRRTGERQENNPKPPQ